MVGAAATSSIGQQRVRRWTTNRVCTLLLQNLVSLSNSPTSVLFSKFHQFIYVYKLPSSKPREPKNKENEGTNREKERQDGDATYALIVA